LTFLYDRYVRSIIAALEFALNQKKELFRSRKLKSFGNRGTPE